MDPLPPYLYVIAMEALGCLFKKVEIGGFLLGYWMGGKGGVRVQISHLLFVDDTLVFLWDFIGLIDLFKLGAYVVWGYIKFEN